MNKKQFSIKIKSPKEQVWKVLWDDTTYKMWTSVFSDGSHAITDWKEGSKVLFLSADGNGMYSLVDKNIPNEFMSFKHLGVVKNGKEEPLDVETKKWSGAIESYTLNEQEGMTELIVELDMTEEHKNYFEETFPKALEKIKVLSETKSVD